MRIQRLELVDFRNYPALSLELPVGASILLGPNGAGKTNVLEAAHLVLTGFSHRAGKDAEMVRQGTDAFSVRASVERDALPGDFVDYQVQYRDRHKTVRRGRTVLTGRLRSAAMGAAVAFAPDDLNIVKGTPSTRRTFVDSVATKAAPSFRTALRRYEAAVSQRNRLLAEWAGTATEEDQLNAWSAQMVSCGGVVLAYRLRCLARLAPEAARAYERLAGADERLGLSYCQAHGPEMGTWSPGEDGAPADPVALGAGIAVALAATRREERLRAMTLVGPHRDDLRVTIDGKDSRLFASQGQQRSVALALRLSESALLDAVLSERPVLLLDDVFSELDQRRRDALLELLGLGSRGQQTLVTATDLAGIPARELGAAAEFAVGDGTVSRIA